MAQSTFSLSWDLHRNNICNGLSVLQQNEEFVDMTLAADGHHVKVHQMVMALSSPYIKELISTADCPHPVIFLNKISFATLSAILEYIYTGEVLVSVEHLSDLIEAARELHIKGLEDMDIRESSITRTSQEGSVAGDRCKSANIEDEICYFEVTNSKTNSPVHKSNYTLLDDGIPEDSQSLDATLDDNDEDTVHEEEVTEEPVEKKPRITSCNKNTDLPPDPQNISSVMQYTVSNQGSLQMILNRYVYYLKHCNLNNSRQWRCVDYLNKVKCPAIVFTKDDVVVQRIAAHTHPFHDRRILKKVHAGAVFTVLQEAEKQGQNIKRNSKEKSVECKI